MSKNWKGPIGPVTVKNVQGDTWVFPTLVDAIKARSHRSYKVVDCLPRRFPFGDGFVSYADQFCIVILDESGIAVPVWRVEQEAQGVEMPDRYWHRRTPNDYKPERDFRKAPLPGRGRRRWGRFYRHMHTIAELRDLHGLEADMMDAEDYPVRVKIRGRRKNLPTLWDDIIHSRRGDGWKNYRKTQYK
ncbi:hypothetical protein [Pseudosulfitobacter pseudonitzschiae]|uniref:hypothetical protein n=1 Tax=Pseudosulfitobacter pseudonitzschiae TaxID=1402135 RepID=UPI003B7789F1